jgi:hypothetical protein
LPSVVLQHPGVRGREDEDGRTHDDREVHLLAPVAEQPQRKGDQRSTRKEELEEEVRARVTRALEEEFRHGAILGGSRFAAITGAMPGISLET